MTRPIPRHHSPVLLAIALLGFTFPGIAPALGAPSPPPSSADPFPTLAQRNLFDPTRTKNRPPSPEPQEQPPPDRPRAQFFTLTGTMLHGSNAYAFFSGSQPEYHQILPPQQHIAALLVAEITTAHVVLQEESNRWILPIGRQLRREGNQAWELSTTLSDTPPATTAPASPGQNPSKPTPRTPSPPSQETDDLLKQMMERREKEMSP